MYPVLVYSVSAHPLILKDELLEVLQFPTKDPGCGVLRVRAKVSGDGATGWVSVAGNAGTCFLEPC